jgi:HK97 family phage major capsid protein
MTSLLPRGMNFTRLAIAIGKSQEGDKIQAVHVARNLWGENSPVVEILRSAVTAGSTLDTSWAQSIAPMRVAAAEFVSALRATSVLGKMSGMRHVPCQTRIPRATSGSSVGWVGQRSPTPLSALSLDTIELAALKLSGLMSATLELIRASDPSAEALIRQDLLAAVSTFTDSAMLDPTAGGEVDVSAASLTYGAPAVTATGTTAAACKLDVKSLVRTLTDAGINLTSPYLITDRKTAVGMACGFGDDVFFQNLTVNGGTLGGIPLITSNAMAADTNSPADSNIVLIDAAEIILADSDEITLDLALNATIEMDDAPSSPPTASTVQVSLWQHNLACFRVVRPLNWALRRPGACAMLTGVSY